MALIHLTNQHPRMTREARTIEAMIRIYCRRHHGRHHGRHDGPQHDDLCAECAELQDYAGLRLEKCPFQENKGACAQCAVHCYKPAMRERVRAVMRYAGPRMLFRHPVLAFMHLIVDKRRTAPMQPKRKPNLAR